MQISRRRILQLAGASALGGCLGGLTERDGPGDDDPFDCGVASGDPTSDAVILWTRVRPPAGAGAVALAWELASDEGMRRVVARGEVVASAERDHCAKVEARGLAPDREYFFRFLGAEAASPVGRTRTAPTAADALRFAVCSCSNLRDGRFESYAHIAGRDDLNAVLHLGDYIYEYEDDHGPVVDLDDYRRRHREYRRDADLRAMHARHPFLPIWDDHEIANNVHAGSDPDRIAAATRAYFEYMPVRELGGRRIHRAMPYGGIAELIFLDTRLEGRDRQARATTIHRCGRRPAG